MIPFSPVNRRRNQSLDVLRAVAVVAVIGSHYPRIQSMKSGSMGVDLFFVLSGFLISGLLFQELISSGAIRMPRFFLRRGLKIYPAFYFFLAVTALLFPGLRPHWRFEALFLQSYYAIPMPQGSPWAHLWSLAVEEHFYLVLPFVVVVLQRTQKLHLMPWISAGLIALDFFLRAKCAEQSATSTIWQSHLRVDELFAGVALGYLYHFHREKFRSLGRWYLLPLGILLVLPGFLPAWNGWSVSAAITCELIGFSLIVLYAVPRTFPGTKHIAEIGEYSYSIYLWQMAVAIFWRAHEMSWLGFFGYLVSSIAVGVAMAVIVEMPVLSLRDRCFPSRTAVEALANRTSKQDSAPDGQQKILAPAIPSR